MNRCCYNHPHQPCCNSSQIFCGAGGINRGAFRQSSPVALLPRRRFTRTFAIAAKTGSTLLRLVRINTAHLGPGPRRGMLHPFYLAPYAEYPVLLGFGLLPLMMANVHYLSEGFLGLTAQPTALLMLGCTLWWMRDLVQMGANTATYGVVVRQNLRCGVLLFIISEVMVFFGLFWAYFHTSLNPVAELGGVWPPAELLVLDWYRWPTLSTALLVYSGFSANAAYYALRGLLRPRSSLTEPAALAVYRWFGTVSAQHQEALLFGTARASAGTMSAKAVVTLRHRTLRRGLTVLYGGLCYTIFAGGLFLLCQSHEYAHATFAMADGAYASVFYGLTGLHGLHVLAGLLLLLGVLGQALGGYLDRDVTPAVLFSGALWYWHFVDLVWLGLYGVVYVWGNAIGAETLA